MRARLAPLSMATWSGSVSDRTGFTLSWMLMSPRTSRPGCVGAFRSTEYAATKNETPSYLPRFARDGNLEDVLCKTHSDRRIFHSDSSFFDAFFRLTLAHRCRPVPKLSPFEIDHKSAA